MFMMTSAVALFAERGVKHLYLGTCYSQTALYKTQFAGAEFFNGFRWSDDLDELKFIIKRDKKELSQHLLETEAYRDEFYKGDLEKITERERIPGEGEVTGGLTLKMRRANPKLLSGIGDWLQRHWLAVIQSIFTHAEEISRRCHAADFKQEFFADALADEVHEFLHPLHLRGFGHARRDFVFPQFADVGQHLAPSRQLYLFSAQFARGFGRTTTDCGWRRGQSSGRARQSPPIIAEPAPRCRHCRLPAPDISVPAPHAQSNRSARRADTSA